MLESYRKPLGMALQNSIMPGDLPTVQTPPMPGKKPGFLAPNSKGAVIAGIIGDMLAQASGGQAQFIPMMAQQRRDEQQAAASEAQWSRRREADNQDWITRQQWALANKPPEVSPMQRDARSWLEMSDAEREAYKAAQMVRPQFIPDGLGGGQWASPAGVAQQPAIGAVMPDPRKAGGPSQPATGGFR